MVDIFHFLKLMQVSLQTHKLVIMQASQTYEFTSYVGQPGPNHFCGPSVGWDCAHSHPYILSES